MKKKIKFNMYDKVILLVTIICFILIPSLQLGIRYDVLGEVAGIIGTLTAIGTAIATIIYTENARKKQNEYQYKKEKLEKSVDKLGDVLYEHIEKINPIKAISIPITFSKPQEMVDYLLTNIMNHKVLLSVPKSKIYWYYDDEQYKNSVEVKEFIEQFDKTIKEIDDELNRVINVVQNAIKELIIVSQTQTLDINCVTENDVILKMNNELDEYYKKLVEIEYGSVQMLYEKAKLVIKEYEEYKYEKLEK